MRAFTLLPRSVPIAARAHSLLPLPDSITVSPPAPRSPTPMPAESLQHPLRVYDALLQVTA